jgi:hypothetical protein
MDSVVAYNEVDIPVGTYFHRQPTTVSEAMTFGNDGSYSAKEVDASGATTYIEAGTFTIYGSSLTISVTSANGQPLGPSVQRSFLWSFAYDEKGYFIFDALTFSVPSGGKFDNQIFLNKN